MFLIEIAEKSVQINANVHKTLWSVDLNASTYNLLVEYAYS